MSFSVSKFNKKQELLGLAIGVTQYGITIDMLV